MADETWLTHAPPRITELTFADALTETKAHSFIRPEEIDTIWKTFLQYGVDPSFALGQFWTESLFGTAGWNVWADPRLFSWGNILWENTFVADVAGVNKYAASNGFNYTRYPTWTTGVVDYCMLLNKYASSSPDSRYGDTTTIYGATAKWMAKTPGSDEHIRYLDVVLGRMNKYDSRPPFEGEMAIYGTGITYTSNQRYAIKAGDRWYLKPGGAISYPFKADGQGYYLGQVNGTSWFAIRVVTARMSADGKSRPVIGYVPNFDPTRVSHIS